MLFPANLLTSTEKTDNKYYSAVTNQQPQFHQ